ncbi:heavy-metal-associated domain-containing protein [Leifsonia virtsii]|uniref:Heavy-metal-associated domain-containing protein n=1 Tax=Leifsonia virtsii TaxID=3035915 RepID=A0ABT8IVL5_9MICO|nr:heavy-metal-associated domain-containing protein [Leifsonia virtsii]MDN4596862.1 heavy-metal-associated domain-containing protein [Leifsonia virtsii]
MQTIEYQVTGMTCEHCERAVTEEVTRVAGVREVTVSSTDGLLAVSADGPVDDAAVLAAVDEAGYSAERR